VALPGEEEEAKFVAEELARQRGEGRPWSHFAVLYRLNAQSRPIEEALRESGIPYDVHGGPAFFDRAEVKDLLAWLKLCTASEDEVSLARVVNVPPRGIGDTSMERLHGWAVEQRLGLFEALRRAAEATELPRGAAERMVAFAGLVDRYRERFTRGDLAAAARELVAELDLYSHARASVQSAVAGTRKVEGIEGILRSLEGYVGRNARPSLAVWLQRLALDSREEEDPADGAGVALMTLHAAKGLEFPVVFLVGCEEDLLPCAGIQGEARDLDEERRLAYVGITRARELLYMTRAVQRVKRGKPLERTASRFIDDLPAGAHERVDPAALQAAPQEIASLTESVVAGLRARLAAAKPP
jgi:DNA helicase-2/ATP-dependent DNA helicase PcrA